MGQVYYVDTKPVLPHRVNQVPMDGDMNNVRAIDQTPDGGGRSFKGVHAGRHCDTSQFPSKVEWQGPSDHLIVGDFNTGEAGVLHVSGRAKDFIDSIEPGVHQFVPFTLICADAPLADRYWWVIGNRIDSVDRQHSNYVLLGGRMWRTGRNVAESFPDHLPPDADVEATPTLVFSEPQIAGVHVWRDKFLDTGGPLASDFFARFVQDAGLSGVAFIEAGETG